MIPSANTIIYPWTMMIKSFDTSIANITMPASFSPDYFTFGAKMIRIEFLNNVEKVNMPIFLNVSWISKPRTKEKHPSHDKQCMRPYE